MTLNVIYSWLELACLRCGKHLLFVLRTSDVMGSKHNDITMQGLLFSVTALSSKIHYTQCGLHPLYMH